jgi:hypothetical protein
MLRPSWSVSAEAGVGAAAAGTVEVGAVEAGVVVGVTDADH